MTNTIPVFYDCEASSLDGVPIEIGWASIKVNTDVIISEGHLIRPPPDWPVEESWDPVAEDLHGISLSHLKTHGRPVWEIARRMNNVLEGRELFADSPLDEVWLRRIFEETGLDPAFTVRRTDAEVLISGLAVNRGLDAGTYGRIKATAAHLAPHQHRAEADARHLAVRWHMVVRGILAP